MRPRIRAAILTGYAGLAASLGLNPDRLVTSVGLRPADLDAPDRWVPAGAAARLLELSARRPGFGQGRPVTPPASRHLLIHSGGDLTCPSP